MGINQGSSHNSYLTEKMATTMDTPMHDISHDTLMGLQELDSQLSLFDTTGLDRDSSTTGVAATDSAIAVSTLEESFNTSEHPLHTIVVDTSHDNFQRKITSDAESRTFSSNKPMFRAHIQYVFLYRWLI